MEPGHEDREYNKDFLIAVTKTIASMEPGHEDREYKQRRVVAPGPGPASMEPGHEDREYLQGSGRPGAFSPPQWSPVMKTGNTRRNIILRIDTRDASMEPGHEDREYLGRRRSPGGVHRASMEPGHEDREYELFGGGKEEK